MEDENYNREKSLNILDLFKDADGESNDSNGELRDEKKKFVEFFNSQKLIEKQFFKNQIYDYSMINEDLGNSNKKQHNKANITNNNINNNSSNILGIDEENNFYSEYGIINSEIIAIIDQYVDFLIIKQELKIKGNNSNDGFLNKKSFNNIDALNKDISSLFIIYEKSILNKLNCYDINKEHKCLDSPDNEKNNLINKLLSLYQVLLNIKQPISDDYCCKLYSLNKKISQLLIQYNNLVKALFTKASENDEIDYVSKLLKHTFIIISEIFNQKIRKAAD